MDDLANKTHSIYETAVLNADQDGKNWASNETKFLLALAIASEQILYRNIPKDEVHEVLKRVHFGLTSKYLGSIGR